MSFRHIYASSSHFLANQFSKPGYASLKVSKKGFDTSIFPKHSQPSLEILCGIATEGFVELGLLKQRRAAGHIQHRIPTILGKVGQFLFRNGGVVGGHVDLITQNGRPVQHILQIAEGWFKELADTLTGEPEGIEKLIVCVCHSAVHQRSIVVSLDYAEGGGVLALVERVKEAFALFLEGHIFRHEFEILDTALGDDQLDVLDISRRGIACELADVLDIVIKEPILHVGVKGAGLEETVTQKHHAVSTVSVLVEYLGFEQSLTVPDDVFDLGFFFLCFEVVTVGFLDAYHVLCKAADPVSDDEDRFLRELDDVLDTTECKSNIYFSFFAIVTPPSSVMLLFYHILRLSSRNSL